MYVFPFRVTDASHIWLSTARILHENTKVSLESRMSEAKIKANKQISANPRGASVVFARNGQLEVDTELIVPRAGLKDGIYVRSQ